MSKYPTDFTLYKMKKEGNGSALSVSPNFRNKAMYLSLAAQGGEGKFDWKNKIVLKLSDSDVASMLAVLSGKMDKHDKIYHEYNDNVTKGGFGKSTKYPGFGMRLSKGKKGQDPDRTISVFVSTAEAVLLEEVLRHGFRLMLGWDAFATQVAQEPEPVEVGATSGGEDDEVFG